MKYLTKEELILVHLLINNHDQDDYIVKESITEQGIQREVNCDLSYISRLLKDNERNGYLYRKKLNINTKKRKQNAFFLTEKGKKIAKDIIDMKIKPQN